MEVEKIKPLECPGCKSKSVTKRNALIDCDDCFFSFHINTGEKVKRTKNKSGKGHNPRFDTGDYLE